MKMRQVPGTDLSLSVVGMGCWTISGKYWGTTDDDESVATIRAAVDAGINWFDTAPLYGEGHADRLLVRALGDRLKDVILATKVGVRMGEGPQGADGHAHSDLRPEYIVADCEASLRRLRRPLDLLQVHWPCEWNTPLEDTLAALEDLRSRGWIRYWGLCNYDATSVRRARPAGMATLQTPYSLLRREFEQDLLAACTEPPGEPVGVLAYESLCRGLLSGRFRGQPHFPETDQRSRDPRFHGSFFQYGSRLGRDLAAVGEKVGVSGAAVALGWVASQPGVTAVIAGARTPAQIRANAKVSELVDRPKLWSVVNRVAQVHGPPPR